jgi:hypothetical protein
MPTKKNLATPPILPGATGAGGNTSGMARGHKILTLHLSTTCAENHQNAAHDIPAELANLPLRDHDNHHNALRCPYCNPKQLVLVDPAAITTLQAQLLAAQADAARYQYILTHGVPQVMHPSGHSSGNAVGARLTTEIDAQLLLLNTRSTKE